MLRLISIFLVFLFKIAVINLSLSQNLILNPGFEDYSACPSDQDQIDRLNDWNHYFSTPDYLNVCGYHHSDISYYDQGAIYLAIYTGLPYASPERGAQREYAEGKLAHSLRKDSLYLFEIQAFQTNTSSYSTNNFGLFFSETPYTTIPDTNYIRVQPDIYWPDKMTEKERWHSYRACYKARGGEQYLTLGGFFNNKEVKITSFDNGITNGIILDNVSLTKLSVPEQLEISPSADTICAGDCIRITNNMAHIPGNFFWELPGSEIGTSSDSTLIVCYQEPGQYDLILRVDNCAGEYNRESIGDIYVMEPILHNAISDTALCVGDAFHIDLTETLYEVSWEDGYPDRIRNITESGEYAYLLRSDYCEWKDSFKIEYLPSPEMSYTEMRVCEGDTGIFRDKILAQPGIYYDTLFGLNGCDSIHTMIDFDYTMDRTWALEGAPVICADSSTQFGITGDFLDIKWSTGSTDMSIIIDREGDYFVDVLGTNGCRESLAFYVEETRSPYVEIKDLVDPWFSQGLALSAQYSGDVESVIWEGGELSCYECRQPILLSSQSEEIIVYVTNIHGCSASDTLTLNFKEANIFLPNIIRYRANIAANSTFFLQSDRDIVYSLDIYDRWGGIRYSSEGLKANISENSWTPPENMATGVYVYKIEFIENGVKKRLVGDVVFVK